MECCAVCGLSALPKNFVANDEAPPSFALGGAFALFLL